MMADQTISIGWDVGGWNCDKNPRSRDAIVIIDAGKKIVGTPWRGNLRRLINEAATTAEWVAGLFTLCQAGRLEFKQCVMAIDTPLAFSDAFVNLVGRGEAVSQPLGQSQTNPYLYRQTERLLFDHGLRPLSAVKDLIGSQATKGMHVLAKFAPHTTRCGVWTADSHFSAIESYPTACKLSPSVADLRRRYGTLEDGDREDALYCALVAHLFAHHNDKLWGPTGDAPITEGWIWIPNDAVAHQ